MSISEERVSTARHVISALDMKKTIKLQILFELYVFPINQNVTVNVYLLPTVKMNKTRAVANHFYLFPLFFSNF